ncbi:MAG TPA: AI-2E family transporter [Solirubrobacterales bacterium]|nr:AI-2E family transporter [Solirubrobacterales bacterium]
MEPEASGSEYVDIDPSELKGLFAAPDWLRDFGFTSWLLLGIALLLAALVALLSLIEVIVLPLVAAGVIAAVASPLVTWMHGQGVPRVIGAILMLLAIVLLGSLIVYVVIHGITSETSTLKGQLSDATDEISGWLQDLGVDPSSAETAKDDASSSISASVSALLDGLGAGLKKLSSLAFFLALTALSLFFLLKDAPQIRAWGERSLDLPPRLAHSVVQRVLEALRGYFLGVTIVAAFNGVVVGLGALALGIPMAGTIAIVTFLAAYVPYLGAWTAGAFSVLLALGGAGPDAAAGMVVVQLLANSVLQQIVQPFAMGAALGIHPLAVLVVTLAGGALFGSVGLILAAPITAAAVRIAADVAHVRAGEQSPAPTGEPVAEAPG